MITKFLSHILTVSLLFSGCSKQSEAVPDDIKLSEKSLQLIKSDNNFGFKIFSALPENRTKNIMISPLSVSMVLSMALNGADGETKTAMQNILGFESFTQDEINQIYLDLVTALKKADDKVVLNIANSIWIRKGFPVMNSFTDVNQKYFDASVTNLDFTEAALNMINSWVNSKTNGKIPTILDSISPEEIMFLINAIYFNGKWQIQFDPTETINRPFKLFSGQTVSVPTMKVKEKFGWSQQQNYKALKMPYGRGKFQMIILLPDEGITTETVAKNLDRLKWEALLSSLTNPAEIDVWLPRFEYSWESQLKDVLSTLGMSIAFTDNADFSRINPDQQLLITKVKHKTYIKVNEEGTEAAAVTSVGIGVTSFPPNQPEFHVDRPFLYLISEEDTGAILFIGKVENPLLKE